MFLNEDIQYFKYVNSFLNLPRILNITPTKIPVSFLFNGTWQNDSKIQLEEKPHKKAKITLKKVRLCPLKHKIYYSISYNYKTNILNITYLIYHFNYN